jgi:hypothetical protein
MDDFPEFKGYFGFIFKSKQFNYKTKSIRYFAMAKIISLKILSQFNFYHTNDYINFNF